MGLMFARRRAESAKAFKGAKAKAHAKNHSKAHAEAGNLPLGSVVSKPLDKPAKAAENGANKPGAK